MEILKPSEAGKDAVIRRLGSLFEAAGIAAFPTETFYGLGAKFDDERALVRLYQIKQRPLSKAMPLLIGSRELLPLLTPALPEAAEKLIRRFWPGPLTLILQATAGLSPFVTAGTGTVAVRMPGPSFAFDLAEKLGYPITATSANISGRPPARTAADVVEALGSALSAVVDCGAAPGRAPSTIVDLSGPDIRVVRVGMIPPEEIGKAL